MTGSSAMPQIGQVPGASRRISGCIGHVYWLPGGTLTGSTTAGDRYFAGSAMNFVRQPAEQNRNSVPACSAWCGESGLTVIPQTGS